MSSPEIEISYPADLPVSQRRDDILSAIAQNQVVIVAGATGSGKTTQLPKMLLESGFTSIGHTQPRRIAARTVAERIADELAHLLPELLRDALGDGARGDAPGLGVPDRLVPELEQHLGQLGGLARAGGARDDDDLVVADGVADVIPALADGQALGVGDDRDLRHEPFIVSRAGGRRG